MPQQNINDEVTQALSAIAGIALDLYTKQVALFDLLSQNLVSPEAIQEALDRSRAQINQHPALKSLRIGTDSSALEVAQRVL